MQPLQKLIQTLIREADKFSTADLSSRLNRCITQQNDAFFVALRSAFFDSYCFRVNWDGSVGLLEVLLQMFPVKASHFRLAVVLECLAYLQSMNPRPTKESAQYALHLYRRASYQYQRAGLEWGVAACALYQVQAEIQFGLLHGASQRTRRQLQYRARKLNKLEKALQQHPHARSLIGSYYHIQQGIARACRRQDQMHFWSQKAVAHFRRWLKDEVDQIDSDSNDPDVVKIEAEHKNASPNLALRSKLAKSLLNYASLLIYSGEIEQADAALTEGMHLQTPEHFALLATQIKVRTSQGQFSQAIHLYETLCQIPRRIQRHHDIFQTATITIANAYHYIGDTESALGCLDRAQAMSQSQGFSEKLGRIWHKRGMIYLLNDDFSRAVEAFEQASAVFQELELRFWLNDVKASRAVLFYKQGRFSEALELGMQIVKYTKDAQKVLFDALMRAWITIGWSALAMNQIDRAEDAFRQGWQRLGATPIHDYRYPLAHGLARVAMANKNSRQAFMYLRKAYESIQQVSFNLHEHDRFLVYYFDHRERMAVYLDLVQWYFKRNRWVEAFTVIEQSKSRATASFLTTTHSPKHYQVESQLNTFCTTLPATSVAIAFYPFGERWSALLIFPDRRVFWVPLGLQADVKQALAFWQRGLQQVASYLIRSQKAIARIKRHTAVALGDLSQLFDALWRPLLPFLQNEAKQTILVIPHGILHELPFAALYDSETKQYVIDNWRLAQIPAASVYAYTERQKPAADFTSVTALGCRQPDLEFVKTELDLIAQIYPTAAIFLDRSETNSILLQAQRRGGVLHLAGHGVYNKSQPEASYLTIGLNQFLRLSQIYQLRFKQTALVVLSGCETGLAHTTLGDERIGLLRGFLQAGVPRLVSGLWRIHDATTAAWMAVFYHQLKTGVKPIDACRVAMQSIRDSGQPELLHPAFWAGMTYMGVIDPEARSDALDLETFVPNK